MLARNVPRSEMSRGARGWQEMRSVACVPDLKEISCVWSSGPYPSSMVVTRGDSVELWNLDPKTGQQSEKLILSPAGSLGRINVTGTHAAYRQQPQKNMCKLVMLQGESNSMTPAGEAIDLMHEDEVSSISMSANMVITSSYDRTAKVWSMKGEMIHLLEHPRMVGVAAISSAYAATGSIDSIVRLFSLVNGNCLREFIGHEGTISCIALSEASSHITVVSGGWDSTVRLFDHAIDPKNRNGPFIEQKMAVLWHSSVVSDVAISKNSRFLLSGSCDYLSNLFELKTTTVVTRLSGHRKWVDSVSLNPDGTYACTASPDETVRFFDLFAKDRKLLLEFCRCIEHPSQSQQLPMDVLRLIKRMMI